jgi:hypothetical protein
MASMNYFLIHAFLIGFIMLNVYLIELGL